MMCYGITLTLVNFSRFLDEIGATQLGIGRTWEKFSSSPAKKPRKFETATGKENF